MTDIYGLENSMLLPRPRKLAAYQCDICPEVSDDPMIGLPRWSVYNGAIVEHVCHACWQVHMCKECRSDLAAGPQTDLCKQCERKHTLKHYTELVQMFSNHQGEVGPWLREHCKMEEGK